MQGPMDRRDFLSKSAKSVFLMSAAGSALAARNPVKAIAPSDKVRIAGIGSGGRGSSLVSGFLDHKAVARPFARRFPGQALRGPPGEETRAHPRVQEGAR